MRLYSMCCAAILVAPVLACAADKRPMTVEDLWKVKRVGPPTISPDGKWCAVEVTTFKPDSNDSISQIWLLSTDGKTQKQLTTFDGKNSVPKWSPDGKSIAFVSKRGGDEGPQIYVIGPEGGEAHRVTEMPFAPSALKWAGDSSKIYFIAWTWPDTSDDKAYRDRVKQRAGAKSKAVVIDSAAFRYWDHWLTDGKRPFVFAVDLKTGEHRNLMAGTGHSLPLQDPSEQHYDVAPDGKELCYTHDNVKDPGMDVNLDLFTLRLDEKDAKPKCITEDNKANDWYPRYVHLDSKAASNSASCDLIAFLRQSTKFFYADQARVKLYSRKEEKVFNGESDEIGSVLYGKESPYHFDRSIANQRFETNGLSLSFLFEAEDAGYMRQFFFFIGGTALLAKMKPDTGSSIASVDGTDFAKWGIVAVQSSFDRPAMVISILKESHKIDDLKRDGAFVSLPVTTRQIDHFNDGLVSQWKLGKVEDRTFKGAGGRDVQMFVVYPPDFDPSKKWPLVQMVHGGPHNAFHNDFSFRWNPQLWAARGWVVSIVNFHGSSSFGQEFTDSITGDMGSMPLEDIMKATDWFAEQPWIDKDRMAAAGASYGGYMMSWLNGHTDRFKAMVCHAGVYNWHSMLASDVVRGRERALGAMPWGNLDKIDRQSPQRYAKNFKTPTLVSHGEQDFRVPVTQGLEYYNTLRQKGVPTRLIYFPDENHWILKQQNSLLWHKEVFAWLEKYIGSGPTK